MLYFVIDLPVLYLEPSIKKLREHLKASFIRKKGFLILAVRNDFIAVFATYQAICIHCLKQDDNNKNI
jgi:hypothetical protein